MSPKKIEKLFQALDQSLPDPKSELDYRNHFELLIAVILSAQATDVSVNKVTPALFAAAPTPLAMIKLGEEGIREKIKSIGLYNAKAKNISRACQLIVQDYKSEIPASRKELERLPGVGTKTAGVLLNIAFNQPTIPVDTHVFRVSNRTGLVKTKTPQQTEQPLLNVVPDWVKQKAHHLLILHGRYTCKARKPLCHDCAIDDLCEYTDKVFNSP